MDLRRPLRSSVCVLFFLAAPGLSFLECFLTFPLPLCGFGRLLLYRPFGLGIFKFLLEVVRSRAAMNSARRDAIASLPFCVRSWAARNSARRDAIAALPVSVRRGGMNDAWSELGGGVAGQPYSALVCQELKDRRRSKFGFPFNPGHLLPSKMHWRSSNLSW